MLQHRVTVHSSNHTRQRWYARCARGWCCCYFSIAGLARRSLSSHLSGPVDADLLPLPSFSSSMLSNDVLSGPQTYLIPWPQTESIVTLTLLQLTSQVCRLQHAHQGILDRHVC